MRHEVEIFEGKDREQNIERKNKELGIKKENNLYQL